MELELIKKLKNDTVNLIINALLLIGGITIALLIIRDYPNILTTKLLIEYSLFALLAIISTQKKRIPYHFKTNFIIWGLFALMIVATTSIGFHSSSKIYVILAPVFTSFLYSYKKSYLLLVLFVIAYFTIGYLKTNGFLSDTNTEMHFKVWLVDGAVLVLASYILLFIGNKYQTKLFEVLADLDIKNQELRTHRDNLEQLVKERTEEIETANNELKVNNAELSAKNVIIIEKNIEINDTLQQLKETQSQLLQADKMASLGTLTAGVAHEINNPLNYIMGTQIGLTNYFEEHGSADKTKTDFFLHSLATGIERISAIVRGLNQLSRDNENLNEECEVHSILDNCIVMLNSQTENKVEIMKNYTSKNIVIRGNVGKLHQLFINILGNAIQATSENHEIRINTNISEATAIIEIIDNGIGIEKQNITRITDPFYTTKPPGEGTGLGLAISYSIIKDHKGKLEFDSEIKKGTKVIITIPLNS